MKTNTRVFTRFASLSLACAIGVGGMSGCRHTPTPSPEDTNLKVKFDLRLFKKSPLEGATARVTGFVASGNATQDPQVIKETNDNTVNFPKVPVNTDVDLEIIGEKCPLKYTCNGAVLSTDGITIEQFIDEMSGETVVANNDQVCLAEPIDRTACKDYLKPCSDDSMCGPGTICDEQTNTCIPQCDETTCPNGECVNNVCMDGGCGSNADCPNGQVCQNGMCQNPPDNLGPLCVVQYPGGFIFASNLPGAAWDLSLGHFGRIENEVCTPFKES